MKIYDCKKMREIEEKADENGFSYLSMMENAGKTCAQHILRILNKEGLSKGKVSILCGKGNNGGDGMVIAQYLKMENIDVSVILTHHAPVTDIADEMYKRVLKSNITLFDIYKNADKAIDDIVQSACIIDCIFGIGFKGSIEGTTAELIDNINKMNKCVVSIDIPSGLECNGAKPEGAHLNAVYTLAIGCQKPVHVMKNTSSFCGKTLTVDIGFDRSFYGIHESFECIDDQFIRKVLIKRESDANKGNFGKLLSIAGSKNMPGAAVLCANAAVLSGAGLVTCAFPSKAYPAIAPKITEPTMIPAACDENGFFAFNAEKVILNRLAESTAAVIGCGLGLTEDTSLLVYSVIKNAECPLVIDADGINSAALNINILKAAKAPLVLTPHPGEMARLTGLTVEKIQSNRISVCKKFADMSGAVVVLKGSNTVIAQPGGKVYVNTTGNAGMAKGGCGDMLSGIIGSFLAQGMEPVDAAAAGVYIHGLCGDTAVKDYSLTGMTPSIMLDYLPKLFSQFE